jgi:hypothetical protein
VLREVDYAVKEMSLVEELRKWIQTRPKLIGGVGVLRGTGTDMSTQIGSGKIVETVTSSIQNLISTVQTKRPKIIPTVMETIKTYQPGKVVKTVVEQTTKTVQQITSGVTGAPAAPAPTTTVTTTPPTLLRKVR